MITVMVTGIGSNIGQGIVKALRMSEIEARIIGTDINPLSAGLFRCHKGYIVPPATSEEWLKKIIEICNKELSDIILIGSDPEIPFFSAKKADIENSANTIVMVSNYSLVRTFHDKFETVNFLRSNDLHYPKSSLSNPESIRQLKEQAGFPLVIKPRIGAGSKNTFVANNEKQLECALAYVPDPIIQDYISGEEFTTGVFFDKDSKVKGIITMKRELIFGTTYRAIADNFPEIETETMKVAEVLSRYGPKGPINLQSKYCSGKVYTLEINPRFSGTTPCRARFNFNEPEAALRHFLLGQTLHELKPAKGIVMRYWEEVYTTLEEAKEIEGNKFIEDSKSTVLRLL